MANRKLSASKSRIGKLAAALGTVLVLTAATAQAGTVTYTHQTTRVKGHKITIFSKPADDSGGAFRIVQSWGHALWFGEKNLGTAVKFELSGKATAFAVPIAGASIHALAQGADGDMWFADFNSNKVGHVNNKGVFKLRNAGANATQSGEMIPSIGGNLWFVTAQSGLGRIPFKGKIKFFGILNNATRPTALLDGPPTHQTWFVESQGPNVGFVDNDGSVHEFDAGFGGNSNTFGIAYGPDARVWFCDPRNMRISAINSDGSGLVHYSKGLSGAPTVIVDAVDGLYFGESSGAIGKITTGGKITEYPCRRARAVSPWAA